MGRGYIGNYVLDQACIRSLLLNNTHTHTNSTMKLSLVSLFGAVALVFAHQQQAVALEDFSDVFEASRTAAELSETRPRVQLRGKGKGVGGEKKKPILYFVTGNKRKLEETQLLLGDDLVELRSIDIDLPEIQEQPIEVALEKARTAYAMSGHKALIVEDSSFDINALGGMPGPYIKWFLDSAGSDKMFDMMYKFEDKSAIVRTTYAYYDGKTLDAFVGEVNGTIVAPRGSIRMFDSIFVPDGYDQTFVEMDRDLHNAISARAMVMPKLKEFLRNNIDTLDLERED
eukprot:GDKI01014152.1.p1 GENE.GDKI01014152.1~~GDKI01014152.1.p1  ORF type:complete len:286 (-),score=78.77 GDKI01014152.1:21-878(-)